MASSSKTNEVAHVSWNMWVLMKWIEKLAMERCFVIHVQTDCDMDWPQQSAFTVTSTVLSDNKIKSILLLEDCDMFQKVSNGCLFYEDSCCDLFQIQIILIPFDHLTTSRCYIPFMLPSNMFREFCCLTVRDRLTKITSIHFFIIASFRTPFRGVCLWIIHWKTTIFGDFRHFWTWRPSPKFLDLFIKIIKLKLKLLIVLFVKTFNITPRSRSKSLFPHATKEPAQISCSLHLQTLPSFSPLHSNHRCQSSAMALSFLSAFNAQLQLSVITLHTFFV